MLCIFVSWTHRGYPSQLPLNLPKDASFKDLRRKVLTDTGVSLARQRLHLGVPPKYSLDDFPDDSPISSVLTNFANLTLEVVAVDDEEYSSHNDYVKEHKGLAPLLAPKFVPGVRERLLADDAEDKECWVVRSVLSESECKALVQASLETGFDELGWKPTYRSNTRCVVNDVALAKELWKRVRPFCPPLIQGEGWWWEPCGLNECFRFCKYVPGQHFSRHCDGGFVRSPKEVSFYTLNIYLNGGFKGGSTRFFLDDKDSSTVTHSVKPEAGLALMFNHVTKDYLHDGEPLQSNVKFLMRSDVMYRQKRPLTSDAPPPSAVAQTKPQAVHKQVDT